MLSQAERSVNLREIASKTEAAYRGKNWREIPIQECGEPLTEVFHKLCYPFYALKLGLTKDVHVFLRNSLVIMFLEADAIVSRYGLQLKIYDGWRSIETQKKLFWRYLKTFTALKFGLKNHFAKADTWFKVEDAFKKLPRDLQKEIKEENCKYVSWPSSDPKKPSPHATGGAIDVWLYRGDKPVDLGVPFDWMEENAGAFFHFKDSRQGFANDLEICANRNLLLKAMVKVGFSCYPEEIWHFNYGNQMDSLVTGKTAIYSYIKP